MTARSVVPPTSVKRELRPAAGTNLVTYDVSAEGRIVLVDTTEGGNEEFPSIHVVENWYEEFRDREQD